MDKAFYDVRTGNPISAEDFISLYNDSYFIGGERVINGVRQSSRIAEEEIEKILKDGIKYRNDVINLLAWKIGKINHLESDECGKIVFSKDWEKAYDGVIYRYGVKWNGVNKFADYIADNFDNLNKLSEENPQAVLNDLKENSPNGIGTVYLITLLYFISKGRYPIYDRFAELALRGGNPESDTLNEITLPDKNSKKFADVYEEYVKPYSEKISGIFGVDYKNIDEYRNIDRALWVYGHAFKTKTSHSAC